MIPQEVRDLAAGIADDIERNGHYQGKGRRWRPKETDGGGPYSPCCIVLSPSYINTDIDTTVALQGLLPLGSEPMTCWNDNTPTPVVLATLRKIAAGETP